MPLVLIWVLLPFYIEFYAFWIVSLMEEILHCISEHTLAVHPNPKRSRILFIEFLLGNSRSSCLVRWMKHSLLYYYIYIYQLAVSALLAAQVDIAMSIYNWLFKISIRSIIRKRNKKSCRKAQKSQRTECLDNCQMLPAIMMRTNCQPAMSQIPP